MCVNGSSMFWIIKRKENKEWEEFRENKEEEHRRMMFVIFVLFLKQSEKERRLMASKY